FIFEAGDGIRDFHVTGVQTCALPICTNHDIAACQGHCLTPTKEPIAEFSIVLVATLRQAAASAFAAVSMSARVVDCPSDRRIARSEERRVGKERRSRNSRRQSGPTT